MCSCIITAFKGNTNRAAVLSTPLQQYKQQLYCRPATGTVPRCYIIAVGPWDITVNPLLAQSVQLVRTIVLFYGTLKLDVQYLTWHQHDTNI